MNSNYNLESYNTKLELLKRNGLVGTHSNLQLLKENWADFVRHENKECECEKGGYCVAMARFAIARKEIK